MSAIEKQLGLKTGDDDDDDDDKEIEVAKTRWSGQAGMDVTIIGEKNWSDLLRRRGLVVCDLLAISTFAWVGRSSHVSSNLDLGVLLTAAPFYAGELDVSQLCVPIPVLVPNCPAPPTSPRMVWNISFPRSIHERGDCHTE